MGTRVAIAGAGMVGSYLYRIMKNEGISADLYGESNHPTACGINPCAWGATGPFREHVSHAGFDPEEYVLRDFESLNFEGVEMSARLLTFDKPRLVADLLGDVNIIPGPVPAGKYERVIDATGVKRAYLPPIKDDLLVPCVQYRVRAEGVDSSKVTILYGNLGYSWVFPLSDDEFHVGAGSILADPRETLRGSGFLKPGCKHLCGCVGKVRSTSPSGSLPFVDTDLAKGCVTWGVGESIGVVAPIAGEGVVPGMHSARIMVEEWDSPRRYTSRVLRSFSWMAGEKRVIDKVAAGRQLWLWDWLTLRRSSYRMGSPVTVKETREILKCLKKPRRDGEPNANPKSDSANT